jgi:glycine/D-amino acid oxidase-like deaminating enzyme
VVQAQGYEVPAPLRPDLVRLHSTYALVTEPVAGFAGWDDQCLLWESSRPYLYLRATTDGRVMVGGEDEPFRNPRLRDRLMPRKARRMAKRLDRMLPALKAEPAFAWTGTFAVSQDGLPYVGKWDGFPHMVFALAYGGNGITFGVVAADIIRDLCLGHENDDGRIFRLNR